MTRNPAARRYRRRVVWLSLLYAIFLVTDVYAFKHHVLSGALAYAAAVLPALAIIGIFVAIGRYLVEEQDEFLRVLAIRQALWASGFSLSAATIWGFLESFDLVSHVDFYYVAVLWFGGLGLGGCVNWLQGHGKAAI
jgi:hypothetical protein